MVGCYWNEGRLNYKFLMKIFGKSQLNVKLIFTVFHEFKIFWWQQNFLWFFLILLDSFIDLVCHLTNGTRGATKCGDTVSSCTSFNVVSFSNLFTHKHSRDKGTKTSKTHVVKQTEVFVFKTIKTHFLGQHQIWYRRAATSETT